MAKKKGNPANGRPRNTIDDKPRNSASLVLLGHEGQTEAEVRAAATIGPTVQAAYTVSKIEKGGDLNALVDALQTQSKRAISGDTGRMEEMLITQAHTLDLIFNNLTRRAVANMQEGYVPVAETYLRLALKAQSQSRASIESLAQIKNPPVVYARQANFAAGHQQVNNGGEASRVREIETTPTKLLEGQHGERLDTRTTAPASGANQELAPVGAIDGAANSRG
jgi:hypothetical protein